MELAKSLSARVLTHFGQLAALSVSLSTIKLNSKTNISRKPLEHAGKVQAVGSKFADGFMQHSVAFDAWSADAASGCTYCSSYSSDLAASIWHCAWKINMSCCGAVGGHFLSCCTLCFWKFWGRANSTCAAADHLQLSKAAVIWCCNLFTHATRSQLHS